MSLYTPTRIDKVIGWSSFALCVALLLGGVFYGLPRDVAKFADKGASAIPGLVLGIVILLAPAAYGPRQLAHRDRQRPWRAS